MTFVGKTVDSELSGNMIDICPVGALTSQAVPLQRPHLGTVAPQVGQPARRPRRQPGRAGQEQPGDARPAVRERGRSTSAGSSDQDRFSYEGLNSDERLTAADDQAGRPVAEDRLADRARIRRDGVKRVKGESRRRRHRRAGPRRHRTVEELHLLKQLARPSAARTSTSARARRTSPQPTTGTPWLGTNGKRPVARTRCRCVPARRRKWPATS